MTKSGKDVQGTGAADASTGRPDTKLTLIKRRAVEALTVFVLACLVSVGWLAWRNMHAQIASDELETHSRIVMQQWSDLLSCLKDAETGQRGFIITGKEDFLDPYNASFDASITQLADLRRLTADNPTHQQRLAALTPLVAAKLANLKENIALRETQGFTAARQSVMTRSGKNIMGQILVLVGQAQAEEQRLLNERAATSKTNTRKTIQSVFFAGALGCLALLLLVSFLRWELRGRRRAEAAVDASEVQYRTLFNSIDEGFCILEISFDQDGQPVDYLFHETNPAFEKQTGVADATGKRISEIAPWEKAEGIEIYAKVLQTGEPARFVKESTAFNRWFDVYAFRLDGSQSARVAVLLSNITGRKKAEQLLRQNHDTFFNLIQNAPFGLYIVDAQFCVRQVSRASQKVFSNIHPLIGRDFEEVLRQVWTDPFVSEALAHFRHTLQTGEPYAAPNTTEQRQNIPKMESYDWKIERITLPDGKFGVVCYFYDITERMLGEKALRDSEQRFRALVTANSDVVYRMSPDWRQMNQLEGQSSIADTAAPNDNWLQEYIHPDDQQRVLAAIAEAIRTKSLLEMEHQVVTVDGSLGWILSRAVPLLDSNGEIVEWFGTASDVTEQKRAAQALRESELRYRNLFNSMDEGFCIIDLIYDAHGQAVDCRFLESNPAFGKQTGLNDAAGKRLREMVPDSEAEWLGVCGQVALTGEAERFAYEEKGVRSLWFDVYAARLGSAKNPKIAIIFNNITKQKRVVEALRHSEQRFRALFDRGPVAMYSCDTSGMILEFNPCAVNLWGRKPTPDDVDERFCGVSRVYRPDGALLTAAQNPMIAVLKGEMPQAIDMEFVIERPDGSRITVISNIVALKDGQGKITGAINCFYDITERSRLQRQTRNQAQALAELHRRKDEFLAMLSHELRNPMAPLTSAVELLLRQGNQDPVYSQACRVIERQVGQMKHLVNDLLEVSRITSGNVRLRKEPVSVGDIVERALETAQPLILQRQQLLTVSLPPHPVWLNADATRLEQVLVNLLNNAAKYTDMGGRLWLSVGQEGDVGSKAGSSVAVIKVRDTGIGIAAELLPHVFDLFTQAERAIDRSQGGMGIGLSLVRQLVELHEGTVEAHSILGHGSEFTVRLPVIQAAVPPLSLPLPLAKPDGPADKRCRVLAVDDSVDAVESLAILLRLSGHEVQTAYDGAGVLKAALAMRPDVVLLDIGLPGLTGYQVAGQLRQEPRLKNAVLVALTGYGRESDRRRSKNAGFDYHLVKPAGVREVEKILATVGEQLALQTAPDQPVVPEV